MDHQIKMTIVDAIINVVRSAPTMQNFNLSAEISQGSFNTWISYAKSILCITSQYVNIDSTNNQINNIIMQNDSYTLKTDNICNALLEFARHLLSFN